MKPLKRIHLGLAEELLLKNPRKKDTKNLSKEEKKRMASFRKEARELKEQYPVKISLSFKVPWWVQIEDI